jgi:hypothetical protein
MGMLTRFGVPPAATSREAYLHVKRVAWNKSTELRMGKSDGGGPRLRHNLYGRFFLCHVISRETEILDLGAPTRQLIMMRMGTWWGCKNLARAKMVEEGRPCRWWNRRCCTGNGNARGIGLPCLD